VDKLHPEIGFPHIEYPPAGQSAQFVAIRPLRGLDNWHDLEGATRVDLGVDMVSAAVSCIAPGSPPNSWQVRPDKTFLNQPNGMSAQLASAIALLASRCIDNGGSFHSSFVRLSRVWATGAIGHGSDGATQVTSLDDFDGFKTKLAAFAASEDRAKSVFVCVAADAYRHRDRDDDHSDYCIVSMQELADRGDLTSARGGLLVLEPGDLHDLLRLITGQQRIGPKQSTGQARGAGLAAHRAVREDGTGASEHRNSARTGPHPAEVTPPAIKALLDHAIDLLNSGNGSEAKRVLGDAVALAEKEAHVPSVIRAKEYLATALLHFDRDAVGARALLEWCLAALGTALGTAIHARVLSGIAHLNEQEGMFEASESLQRQAIAISERLDDKHAAAEALLHLAGVLGRQGRTDDALGLNRRAYELLIQALHDDPSADQLSIDFIHTFLGNVFLQRAKIHQRRGELDLSDVAFDQALASLRKAPRNPNLARVLVEVAEARFVRQQFEVGATYVKEAAEIFAERGMKREYSTCLRLMGRAHATAGNASRAVEFLRDAARVAQSGGHGEVAAESLLTLGHLSLRKRDVDAARGYFETARAETADPELKSECLVALAGLAAAPERSDEQERLLDEAIAALVEALRHEQSELPRAKISLALASQLRNRGHLVEALERTREARRGFARASAADLARSRTPRSRDRER
jgi:tetratricopeptide (TPR) repeat protein